MTKCSNWKASEMLIVRKCCFCVPLRTGVIIFGYVNLVLSLLSLSLLIFLLTAEVYSDLGKETAVVHPGHREGTGDIDPLVDPLVHLPVTIAFVLADIVMTILLLIGAHEKKNILLKAYFYFGVVFQLLTLCVDLAFFDYQQLMENILYLAFFGLNIYLLFLVYSMIYATRETADVKYVAYRSAPAQHI